MTSNQKYRISNLSKDLNIKSKVLIDILSKHGLEGRTHASVLENDEYNLLMNILTSENQLENFDAYIKGEAKLEIIKPEEKTQSTENAPKKQDIKSAEQNDTPKADQKIQQPKNLQKSEHKQENKAEVNDHNQSREIKSETKNDVKTDLKKEPVNEQKTEVQPKPENQTKSDGQSKPAAQQRHDTRGASRDNRFEKKPDFSQQKNKSKNQKPQHIRQDRPAIINPTASDANRRDDISIESSDNRSQHRAAVNTRVVDTRSSNVDLSKYDEKLDSFVSETKNNAYAPEKQKLKKQNNNNDRDKEHRGMDKIKKQELEKARKQQLSITVPDEITVGELAAKLKVTASVVIKKLMLLGVMANVNQVVDYDTAFLVADELGAKVSKEVVVTIEDKLFDETEDTDENLEPRAPVVVVMGHVDHGKTSLLDAIRHSHVTEGEAGGITQHIGAYRVSVNGHDVTFLDTPGHEAFTAMRARGAQATDIAILVVAADDGIMPQTIEAINHAKAAGLDIIVAINKMEKPGASPDVIKQNLTKYDLVPEEWGGDVICVPVSAVTKKGIDDLLESILIVAEMKELKANPHRRAKGIVIEAKLDKGRGPVATLLVQNGTLNNGDVIIAGTAVGRVRAMSDDKGVSVKSAGPSVPVEIIGLSEVPTAGDEFNAVEDERMARELAEQRREKLRNEQLGAGARVNLEDLFAQISDGVKELNIIVKADVGGSAEAVKQSLEKLSNDEVKVKIIHTAVGGITEGDVMFASASNAIIVGFNVRPDKSALDSAERNNVDIRTYRIIYECIDEISAAMKGMLAPTYKEQLLGHAQVRQTIHVPNVGTIAGSYVQDGKVTRSSQIRVIRDGIVIFEDKISSLRRFKDDVREVSAGYECGIGLESFNDIKENDILEAFEMVEQER